MDSQLTPTTPISIPTPFTLPASIIGVVVLALILRWFYIKYGIANSNRRTLADQFPLLAVSIFLIILLIKSSIALSLGLVGALSIVRFRAAIKEPEELVYLLFAIAIGLGFGADQKTVTTITFFMVLPVVFLMQIITKRGVQEQGLYISFRSKSDSGEKLLAEITDLFEKKSLRMEIRRLDRRESLLDLTVLTTVKDMETMILVLGDLRRLCSDAEVTMIDGSRPILVS